MGHSRTKYNNLVKTPELETDPEYQGPEMDKDPQQFQGPEIEKDLQYQGPVKLKISMQNKMKETSEQNCRTRNYSKDM